MVFGGYGYLGRFKSPNEYRRHMLRLEDIVQIAEGVRVVVVTEELPLPHRLPGGRVYYFVTKVRDVVVNCDDVLIDWSTLDFCVFSCTPDEAKKRHKEVVELVKKTVKVRDVKLVQCDWAVLANRYGSEFDLLHP